MLTVIAAFTKTVGVPATGLTLAEIDLYLTAIAKLDGAQTVIWDGTQHPTAEIASLGMYQRQYSSEDQDTYEYVAGAHYTGVDTLDCLWITAGVASTHTAQELRDAMKLAPSAGSPAAGSIDQHLDDIQNTTDRLDTSSPSTMVSGIVGDALTLYHAATFSVTIPGLTIPSDWTKVLFTLKREDSDLDSAALLQAQISNPGVAADGLIRLNGAAPGTGKNAGAEMTVSQAIGDVAVKLHQTPMSALSPRTCRWDLKVITSDSPVEGWPLVVSSPAEIVYTTTRATA